MTTRKEYVGHPISLAIEQPIKWGESAKGTAMAMPQAAAELGQESAHLSRHHYLCPVTRRDRNELPEGAGINLKHRDCKAKCCEHNFSIFTIDLTPSDW
jgi:hypothetical protein